MHLASTAIAPISVSAAAATARAQILVPLVEKEKSPIAVYHWLDSVLEGVFESFSVTLVSFCQGRVGVVIFLLVVEVPQHPLALPGTLLSHHDECGDTDGKGCQTTEFRQKCQQCLPFEGHYLLARAWEKVDCERSKKIDRGCLC